MVVKVVNTTFKYLGVNKTNIMHLFLFVANTELKSQAAQSVTDVDYKASYHFGNL